MSRTVAEVNNGESLVWVEGGAVWRADRICRGAGYTPWVRVDDAPGMGGRILSDAEVARLVAPHGCGVSR